MFRKHLAVLILLMSAFASGEAPRYLEYRGVMTGSRTYDVYCRILRNEDGLYVESGNSDVMEQYLQIADRAIQLRRSKGDTGVMASLTRPGLMGIGHIPYLPGVVDDESKVDRDKSFVMLTGGQVAEPGTARFTMPVERRERSGGEERIFARYDPDVWAEVTQRGFTTVGSWSVPKISRERYRDGRGEFSYEWTLAKSGTGEDCPEMPSFASVLGPDAVVQDQRRSPIFSFAFSNTKGDFDAQYSEGERIRAEIERQARDESKSAWWAAIAAGCLTLGAGFVLVRRHRGA